MNVDALVQAGLNPGLLDDNAALRGLIYAIVQQCGGKVELPLERLLEFMTGPANLGYLVYEMTSEEQLKLWIHPPTDPKELN